MDADGALEKKLAAIVQMNADNAKALAERSVPTYYFAGSGGADGAASGGYDDEMVRQLRLMNMNSIKSLNLELDVKKK